MKTINIFTLTMLLTASANLAINNNPILSNEAYASEHHDDHSSHDNHDEDDDHNEHNDHHGHGDHHGHEDEEPKGKHGGKLLQEGDFTLELTIFEENVEPQFRIYPYYHGEIINPQEVDLKIQLHRLDGEINKFSFIPNRDFLLGDGVVTEPHSFDVKIQAIYKGKSYEWEFESHEGRTKISPEAIKEANVKTDKVGGATINKYASLMGNIRINPDKKAVIRARFPGIVKEVKVGIGQQVKKGDLLAKIEGNTSLNTYKITSPINGIIIDRSTNKGDVASDNILFTIADLSSVWAELHIFPSDLDKIKQGQKVVISPILKAVQGSANNEHDESIESTVKTILPIANNNSQTVQAIIELDNKSGLWKPNMAVKGKVIIDEKKVDLAVKKSALQNFRDFTVIFAKIGDEYEVRMLNLGIDDGNMIEVLGGVKAGTEYVTENSFLIKADIEKSGASHDH